MSAAQAGPPLLHIGPAGAGALIVGAGGIEMVEVVRDALDGDSLRIVLVPAFDVAIMGLTEGRQFQPLPIRICGQLVAEPLVLYAFTRADFTISGPLLTDVPYLSEVLLSGRCPEAVS